MDDKIKLYDLYAEIYMKLLEHHGGESISQLDTVSAETKNIFNEMIDTVSSVVNEED